jgi:[ribosomal protein S5]-alanine N-acetyltransferase
MEIRILTELDAEIMCHYYKDNAAHFKPWEPVRSFDFYSLESWQQRIIECVSAQRNGEAVHFIGTNNQRVVGHCSLTQIVKGPFQACYMGYGVASDIEGSGVAYKLCQYAIDHAFKELRLHRIMANYMPHNNRSGKLLMRLGFVKEGLAKDYIKIAGKWQNHVLSSLTNSSSA